MKESVELLKEDYTRRLFTINNEIKQNVGKMKSSRLIAKASCYKYFIVELDRILNIE